MSAKNPKSEKAKKDKKEKDKKDRKKNKKGQEPTPNPATGNSGQAGDHLPSSSTPSHPQ